MTNNDTIFALSSGQGKSGVAVIRVSGKDLSKFAIDIVNGAEPRHAYLADFYNIDKLILIYFKAPNSFTGEDVVELHCHGGTAVIEKIFEKLLGFGFRMAERGEFTRRAFDNEKMNLVEVDAMRSLIDAKTEAQRLRALKGVAGKDTDVYMRWRGDMIELAALSAARMDYDADDLPKNINENINERTLAIADEINAALKSRAMVIESGFDVVLVGKTNVGKSSLFNRLLGESRAIVSDIAGTTRDVISAELDIDGYLVRLSDTAGIREAKDEIEKIGIGKTNERLSGADLVLWIYDSDVADVIEGGDCRIVVINKSDLIRNKNGGGIYVSAKTGEGIPNLLAEIKKKVHDALDGAENDLFVTERAKRRLMTAVSELDKARNVLTDLASEHIMNAADEIGQVLGIIGSDEIYDSVFGQLCLGK